MASDEHGVLRRLADKDEIVDLVHRYSYGVDHRRYDEVIVLFTDDCVVDYSAGLHASGPRRAAFAARCSTTRSRFRATSHHNANVLVTFDRRRPCLAARVGVRLAPVGGRHDSAVVGCSTTWPCGAPEAGRSRRANFGCSAWRTGTSNGIGRSNRPSRRPRTKVVPPR